MLTSNAPSWVLPGAKFDLDFANNRYWGGSVAQCQNTAVYDKGSLVVGPAIGIGTYAPDSNGLIRSFGTYTLRVTPGCGLWAEGRYTNYALWCRDCTNAAWTKTNMTAAKNQSGADGSSNTASSLTATGANATVLQAITQASTTFVGSAYVKRLTGTGTVSMTIDGGSTYTDVTASVIANTYTQVSVPTQTLANPSIGFKLGTSGDAIAVDFIQCENYTNPSTPLLTTSATVMRGTDEPTFGTTGTQYNDGYRLIRTIICTGGPFSMLFIASGNSATSTQILSDGGLTVGLGTDGGPASFKSGTGTAATSANNGVFGLGNINKVAGRTNGSGCSVCLNGGAIASTVTTSITPQSAGFTHIGVGNNGSGVNPLNGYLSRFVGWDREITDGQMIEFTR